MWAVAECDLAFEQTQVFEVINSSIASVPIGFAAWESPEAPVETTSKLPPTSSARLRRWSRAIAIFVRTFLDFAFSLGTFIERTIVGLAVTLFGPR